MRRGQAALEYLITYGWGFVILITVIGVLAYLGFLSPTRYIPARCEFGAQLECVDYKLEAAQDGSHNGIIYLRLRNNFGDDINITQAWTADIQTAMTPSTVTVVKGNTTQTITLEIDENDPLYLVKDDRQSVPLTITFQRNRAGAPMHQLTGEIFATVQ